MMRPETIYQELTHLPGLLDMYRAHGLVGEQVSATKRLHELMGYGHRSDELMRALALTAYRDHRYEEAIQLLSKCNTHSYEELFILCRSNLITRKLRGFYRSSSYLLTQFPIQAL